MEKYEFEKEELKEMILSICNITMSNMSQMIFSLVTEKINSKNKVKENPMFKEPIQKHFHTKDKNLINEVKRIDGNGNKYNVYGDLLPRNAKGKNNTSKNNQKM